MTSSDRVRALTCSGYLALFLLFCTTGIAQGVVRGAVNYAVPNESDGARRTFIAQRFEVGVIDSRYGPDAASIRSQNPNFRWFLYNSLSDNYVIPPERSEHDALVALAAAKGWDVEEAYMHYWDDTVVQIQGVTLTIPGWGGGSATDPAQARIPVYYGNMSRRLTHFGTWKARQLYKEVMVSQAFGRPLTNSTIYADGLFLDNSTNILYNYGSVTSGGHVREIPGRPLIGSSAFQTWYFDSNIGPFMSALHDTLETGASWSNDGRPKYLMANVANSWTNAYATLDIADILGMEFQYDPVRNVGQNAIQEAYDRDQIAATAGIANWYLSNMTSSTTFGGSYSYAEAMMGSLAFYLTSRNDNSLLQLFGNHTIVGEAGWDTLCYRGFVDVASNQLGNIVGAPYVLQQGTDPTGLAYKVWAREYTNGLSVVRTRGAWNEGVLPATAVTVNLPRSLKPVSPATSTIGTPTTTYSLRNGNGIFFLNAGPPDLVGPSGVSNLSTGSLTSSTVTLNWTATGDDGTTGTASSYDIRYSSAPLSEANWASAIQVTSEPPPQVAGTAQSMTVTNLAGSTLYYFGLKVMDDGGNLSPLSNVPSATTAVAAPDVTAPATVTNLAVTTSTSNTVSLTWSAPGDDGAVGIATSYDLRYSTAAITAANFSSASGVNGEPAPAASGGTNTMTVSGLNASTTYYFAIKTADEVNNWSVISNVPTGATTAAGGGGGADITPPAPVNDLASINVTSTNLTLRWTAPGDDGTSGTGYRYAFVYSTTPITAANFWSAPSLLNLPLPLASGTQQTLLVSGLNPGVIYYFAMKTADEAFNYASLSNTATVTMLPPPSTGDVTPPATVSNLRMISVTANSITLAWTAPGDDGTTGNATSYDLRWAASNITPTSYAGAYEATGEPAPAVAGTQQTMTVNGLATGTTYYFALRATDDNGNPSAVSNTASAAPSNNPPPTDTTAPAAVSNLAAGTPTTTSLALSWTAPGDDGSTGTATNYDLRYSTATITAANFASATAVTGEPVPAAAGQSQSMTVSGLTSGTTYHWALKTVDEAGNWSGLSNVPSATTTTSGGSSDNTPPAAVTNLALSSPTTTSLTVSWNAPGDDGSTGTADNYDLRYSTAAITSANFNAATPVPSEPKPLVAGTAQSMVVTGLAAGTTYYFALKTADEVPNWSSLSNVPSRATSAAGDVSPPATTTTLAITSTGSTSVTLSWTSPGDDGTSGTANLYDIRWAAVPITEANFSGTNFVTSEPAPAVAGTVQSCTVTGLGSGYTYYFALKTRDEVPNWSALSNVVSTTTVVVPPPDVTAPGAVTSLSVIAVTTTSMTVRWTAPGDDGQTGRATLYDLRYSSAPITAGNFGAAPGAQNEPAPGTAGTTETMVLTGLAPGTTYYLALKTADEVPNWSVLSNTPSGTTATTPPTPDTTAPAAVANLTPGSITPSGFTLSWTAPGDDGSTGTATSYDIRHATTPITVDTFDQATAVTGEPNPLVAGTTQSFAIGGLAAGATYYVALKTADEAGNQSALSNVVMTTTLTEPPVGDTTPPDAISTLVVQAATTTSLTLAWTATGDDGSLGTAAAYDVRYATAPITTETFAAATPADSEPVPTGAATAQSMVIEGLAPGTSYHCAMKVVDESGNWSLLSNDASGATTPENSGDDTPPAAVTNLIVTGATTTTLSLRWSAPGDDGVAGTASIYDIRVATAPITGANFASAPTVEGEPIPGPAGTNQVITLTGLDPTTTYYFALKSSDEASNWSGISNLTSGSTLEPPPADTTPPSTTVTLSVGSPTNSSLGLSWQSPGDDGTLGTATSYDFRMSLAPITVATFDAATPLSGEPVPLPAPSFQSMTVGSLEPGTTYYFAFKTVDDAGNWSNLSNSASGTTTTPPPVDSTPPAAVTDLELRSPTVSTFGLAWSAPGDDGNNGVATAYDLRYSTQPLDESNFASATPASGVPVPGAAGSAQSMTLRDLAPGTTYFVALRTVDNNSNWSPLSNVVTGATQVPPPPPDVQAPQVVNTLDVLSVDETSVTLGWIAPGDDGNVGQAATYDMRFAEFPMTPESFQLATPVEGPPAPAPAGTAQMMTITGLTPGVTYYLGLRTADEIPNWSDLSNVAVATTRTTPPPPVDQNPPAAVTSLSILSASTMSLTLRWLAPGDDGMSGTAAGYDVRYAFGELNELNFDVAASVPGEPTPVTAGGEQTMTLTGLAPGTTYNLALKTVDESGNWSILSNVASGATDSEPPPPPPVDAVAPSATTLTLLDAWADSVDIGWVAPGDDSTSGTAAFYALRMSLGPITEENWSSSTVVLGVPEPAPAGTSQHVVVKGLAPGTTYYFAFRARDEAGNWSSLGQGIDIKTDNTNPDTSPPLAPLGLAGQASGSSVLLRWSASIDPVLAGYNVYRRRTNRGWERRNFDLVRDSGFTDTDVTPNSIWEYAVTAVNRHGQESPRSAGIEIRVPPPRPGRLRATMAAPAPNPFVSAVTVLVEVPEEGLDGATLAIVDLRGRVVRTLHHGTLAAGENPFSWDGVDDGGVRAAAGVYFVRLIGRDTRESKKIVLTR